MTDDTTLKAHTLFNTGYFIDGQWHTSDTTFDVENPATGEVLARVAKAGKTETDAAIAAAAKAFPAWRAKTAKERSEVLYRWYQLIMENQAYLAKLMSAEQGKPVKEAAGEVAYAASFIQWFAEQAKRVNGKIIPPAKAHSRIFATREPVGVVAAITPWNFPLAMLTRKLGPALAAGCTALIKPANATPLSAFALLALAQQAGVPDGVLNGVASDTQAISDAIMASGTVRKVTFTGSTEVGKTLMRNAAGTMKKSPWSWVAMPRILCLTTPISRRQWRAPWPINSVMRDRCASALTAFLSRTACTIGSSRSWRRKWRN
ncbi:NAD/NADP-dependent betaine aldehyde dehydrogenase [Sodalis praecaptivus]